jgi:hypothetical protein
MASIYKTPLDAFNAATPQVKAALIAAACGVFGVICGFVLYVVFTHMFERGDVYAKAAGVAAGLIVSMAVAWTAERLWETIDSGEFKLGGHTRRAFVAGLSLVIVFELSASAFEDFARDLTGDFDGIKRIAGAIAGRETSQADEPLSDTEAAALLAELRRTMTAKLDMRLPTPVTPGARIIELLTLREQMELLMREARYSDTVVAKLLSDHSALLSATSLRARVGPCLPTFTIQPLSTLGVGVGVAATSTPSAEDIQACRQYLLSLPEDRRVRVLTAAMQRIAGRHDLYDTAHFERDGVGVPTAFEPSLVHTLQDQRQQCDAIRGSWPVFGALTCADVARRGLAAPGSGRLIDPSEMRVLNRDLLAAAFPGIIRPLPVLWWDMALMGLMWCASAMVVGAYLSFLTRPEAAGTGLKAFGARMFAAFCALWVAGLIAAAALVLVRLPPFLWQLMIHPQDTVIVSAPGILNIIPGTVRWLASGDALGFPIPAYISLPVLFLTAFMIVARSRGSSDEGLGNVAGFALLGIVLSAVAPVLDGLVGVVLLLVGAWFVPTLSLAFLAPYLRPGRDLPHWWGIVSLFGGLAVAFWVAVVLQETDTTYRGFIACAGLVAASTGALILRRVPMSDLWPLLAITIGLSLVGLSAAFQQLTFAGALKHLHPVSHAERPHGVSLPPTGDDDIVSYLTVLGHAPKDEALPEAFRAPALEDDVAVSLHLELALAGSIGFWLTLSMMVGWALNQGPRSHEGDNTDDARHGDVTAT